MLCRQLDCSWTLSGCNAAPSGLKPQTSWLREASDYCACLDRSRGRMHHCYSASDTVLCIMCWHKGGRCTDKLWVHPRASRPCCQHPAHMLTAVLVSVMMHGLVSVMEQNTRFSYQNTQQLGVGMGAGTRWQECIHCSSQAHVWLSSWQSFKTSTGTSPSATDKRMNNEEQFIRR
jgi:hypothetical protein